MIDQGAEVILGVKRDASFGPVVMFGLGGIFVEVFKDITFRVAPLSVREADAMVRSVRSWPILDGARGAVKRDAASIADCIRRLGQLAYDCPQIREMDINPLIVQPEGKGSFVADVRIML
jgi:acetyltransferase